MKNISLDAEGSVLCPLYTMSALDSTVCWYIAVFHVWVDSENLFSPDTLILLCGHDSIHSFISFYNYVFLIKRTICEIIVRFWVFVNESFQVAVNFLYVNSCEWFFPVFMCVGVSHLVVADDMSGVSEIVKWLSYVPKVYMIIMYFFFLGNHQEEQVSLLISFNRVTFYHSL